jgi:hypothetical protein
MLSIAMQLEDRLRWDVLNRFNTRRLNCIYSLYTKRLKSWTSHQTLAKTRGCHETGLVVDVGSQQRVGEWNASGWEWNTYFT